MRLSGSFWSWWEIYRFSIHADINHITISSLADQLLSFDHYIKIALLLSKVVRARKLCKKWSTQTSINRATHYSGTRQAFESQEQPVETWDQAALSSNHFPFPNKIRIMPDWFVWGAEAHSSLDAQHQTAVLCWNLFDNSMPNDSRTLVYAGSSAYTWIRFLADGVQNLLRGTGMTTTLLPAHIRFEDVACSFIGHVRDIGSGLGRPGTKISTS